MDKKNISLMGGAIALVATVVAVGGYFMRKRSKVKKVILDTIAKNDEENARFERNYKRCRPIIVGKDGVLDPQPSNTPETEVDYKTATINNLKVAFEDLMEIKAANKGILTENNELRK